MVVGKKFSDDKTVRVIPNENFRLPHTHFLQRLIQKLRKFETVWGHTNLIKVLKFIAEPRRKWERSRGIEDFNYPGIWRLFEFLPQSPDVVHCHNLHGDYFDLRALPWISNQVPTILTLHDTWLLSGHCAYSFDCDRWMTGCGHCPDLTTYPAVQNDATHYNWKRKQKIFLNSRLYVSTPSKWLMDKVNESVLAPAVIKSRVIPYGVDLSIFNSKNKKDVKLSLGIPIHSTVLLFAADQTKNSLRRDFKMMHQAVSLLAENSKDKKIIFIALGEKAESEHIGNIEIRYIPFQTDIKQVASYFQAADLYLHASKADNFPNVILEALACGTSVVATAVGGVPEQIRGLSGLSKCRDGSRINLHTKSEATGYLVPAGDRGAFSMAVRKLVEDEPLRKQLGENAYHDARQRFSLEKQVKRYLNWYKDISVS